MKFIVTATRHAAMVEFLKLVPVISLIMLADVGALGDKTTDGIKIEGSLSDHDVIIGSNINLTYTTLVTSTVTCTPMCKRNSEFIHEKKKNSRIKFLLGKKASANRCLPSKLMIKNFRKSDAGKYECFFTRVSMKGQTFSINLYAVTCYQGYYCPDTVNVVPKRCPLGTFSRNKNATSVTDCSPCPQGEEGEQWKKRMGPKTATMFQTNCYSNSLVQEKTSNLSSGAKITIFLLLTLAILFAFVMGILYACHRKKTMTKYRTKLLSPFQDVVYDPPKVPRTNDVFVCYSSKNRQWVREILFPRLKSQHFKVFIDFVDFEIGKSIDDNIVKGIYGSRKTLFILSKDSLKSFYARKELFHALAAGKTGHQVLVILYEKCKAPAEVAGIVYLDWTDMEQRGRFWDRLYNAIRRPLPNEIVHV